ncbi:DUF924 family protein [Bordetella petrii]|uniref:DUF924 family protein n=1 Tax=Bordetella petrii (strain ATCC BAA-461 / DSM 12804 / CCUG 43448 / CIP 107267 / Se-1111R) TaxID=340100 RepID=A9IJ65_BORPD|nr:DUF924 family protein [Bordetella petrii]CAP45338.1 conserved hypothetical protein [Bordetella petrii]
MNTNNSDTVVDFWREAGPARWFRKDEAFDREFSARFMDLHLAAARRQLDAWEGSAYGSLALLILLDQFPRNAFRGTGHMYATDPLARHYAQRLIQAGKDAEIEAGMRVFCYLPLSHSENLTDQRQAVELNQALGEPWLPHAVEHLRIVELFGRFPHRNPLLGRETTAEEQAFLDQGGFAG